MRGTLETYDRWESNRRHVAENYCWGGYLLHAGHECRCKPGEACAKKLQIEGDQK